MKKENDGRSFRSWVRRCWYILHEWLAGIKLWQWFILLAVLALMAAACFLFLPWLGRCSWLDDCSFWDGLERFGNLTGLATVVFAFFGFWNTKRILGYRTSSHPPLEDERSNEAFDVFIRVSASMTDTASMDDFLMHCTSCCPYGSRTWPRTSRDGREIHLARLFENNNEKGFHSSFHTELFESFGDDGQRAKQRFMELLKPVVIRYGALAIQSRQSQAVYFQEHPTQRQQVDGERIVEIYFPMDLPRQDSEQRKAFLAYFSAVLQLLFKYFHNARLCYQGPALLPCIIGDITNNEHILEIYQYDRPGRCYYRIGSSDHTTLITNFLDDIR